MVVAWTACIAIYHFGPPDRYPEGSRYYGHRVEVLKLAAAMLVVSVAGVILTLIFS